MTLSPRSHSKARKEHYLVKHRCWGYLCTLCGNNGNDAGDMKSKPCFPLPDLEELKDAAPSDHPPSLNPYQQQEIEQLRKAQLELEALMKEHAEIEQAQAMELKELQEIEKELEEEHLVLEQALAESAKEAEERAAMESVRMSAEQQAKESLAEAVLTMQDAEAVAEHAVNIPASQPAPMCS